MTAQQSNIRLQKRIVRMCLESEHGGITSSMATHSCGVRGRQTRRALKSLSKTGMLTGIRMLQKNSSLPWHHGTCLHVWRIRKGREFEARQIAGMTCSSTG